MSFQTHAEQRATALGMSFQFTKKRPRQMSFKNPKKFRRSMAYPQKTVTGSRMNRKALAIMAEGVEHKYIDTTKAITALAQVGTSVGLNVDPVPGALNCVAEGDDANTRDGRQIIIDQVHVRGFVRFNGAEEVGDPPDGQVVRILMYLDTQTNAAACASEDVVTNFGASVALSSSFFRNPNGYQRFMSLKEITLSRPAQSSTWAGAANKYTAGTISVPFEFHHKFKQPLKVRFNATNGGNIADIVDNSIHILAAEGGDTPAIRYGTAIAYNARVRFYG